MALRATVLTAIARAVERDGDEVAGWAAIARADPIVRALARRRLWRAYEDALISTHSADGVEGARHVMRVAYLIAAGTPPELADDPGAVLSAYEAARLGAPPLRPRFWWPTVLCAGAAAVLVILLASAMAAVIAPPPSRDASRRAAPAPGGVFAHGGAPEPGPPVVTAALELSLPGYGVALDRWRRAVAGHPTLRRRIAASVELAAARARLVDPQLTEALGPGAARRLRQVLERARAVVLSWSPESAADATEELLDAIGAFDDELAAAGLGYFVDGDVLIDNARGRRVVVLTTYRVERVILYKAGGRTVRALQLRRLDHLTFARDLLGFSRPHLREAAVLLDEVEELLVTYVLPALAPDAGMRVTDEDAEAAGSAWQERLSRRAGEVARAELAGAVPDPILAAQVGALLLRRRALFERWAAALEERGIPFAAPRTFRIDPELAAGLAGLVPPAELDELATIGASLATPVTEPVLLAVRDEIVATVTRHEVQHRVDFARDRSLRLPRQLAARVGPLTGPKGVERAFAVRARDELSAYLGEIGRDVRTTRLNLTLVSRFVFDRDFWWTAECYAALVILEALARELDLEFPRPATKPDWIDRRRLTDVYLALTEVPPEELRAAARRAWERLFAAELPIME